MSSQVTPTRGSNWFGHPRGLTVLFLTEMWEMFSFFGMRAILVYYMIKHLDMSQEYASLVYGAYAAFVYFTPVFGGMLADRWLGKRNAVMIGGAAMALGHFMMSSDALFYPALTTIALGNGLFLPSLASQIEGLYRDGDTRSKSAYNIYYVGINLGGFLAPLVCGTLGEVYGWHWGFAAAGFGMLLSLAIYLAGRRYLPPEPARGAAMSAARPPMDRAARDRFALLIGIAAIVVVFRGAYEQNGNTIALWADTGIDRQLASGWVIPMTWFQSINSLGGVRVHSLPGCTLGASGPAWCGNTATGQDGFRCCRRRCFLRLAGGRRGMERRSRYASELALAVRLVRVVHHRRALYPAGRAGSVWSSGTDGVPCHQHCHVVLCRLLRQPSGRCPGHVVERTFPRMVLCPNRRGSRYLRVAPVYAWPSAG